MKSVVTLFLLAFLPILTKAQTGDKWGYVNQKEKNKLRVSVLSEPNDTLRMADYRLLGFYYQEVLADSAIFYHQKQLELSQKLKLKIWEADAYSQLAYLFTGSGRYSEAYTYFMKAQNIASDEKNESSNWRYWVFSNSKSLHESRLSVLAMNYQMLSGVYIALGDTVMQNQSLSKSIEIGRTIDNGKILSLGYANMAFPMLSDSALILQKLALLYANKVGYKYQSGGSLASIGYIYAEKGQKDSALYYIRKGLENDALENNIRAFTYDYGFAAKAFQKMAQPDSSLFYARRQMQIAKEMSAPNFVLYAYTSIYEGYKTKNERDSALHYLELSKALSDQLNNERITKYIAYQRLAFKEQLRLKKVADEQEAYQNKLKMYGLIGGLAVFLLITVFLVRNNRQKQRTNRVLETTLSNLKTTQSQLIQSEKMASLGELTAGIAHEIQNPLNFVNNFSELNREMIAEMKTEIGKGNMDEVQLIAGDIEANEEKITHHGKRADAIVKGMLAHSRAGKGEKVPTDLNALAEEYLKLSYHGLRAKDSSFNADFKTDFDPNLPKVNVVPQDIGRVLLNLINNAFQACATDGIEKPTVTVSTNLLPEGIEISVKDNGTGIPDDIKDKIFQPFFTTKPTGQGTGLGLSLSYDIVKAHGGDLKVESGENEGTTFKIILPNSTL